MPKPYSSSQPIRENKTQQLIPLDRKLSVEITYTGQAILTQVYDGDELLSESSLQLPE